MKFEKKKKENDHEKYCRNTLWPYWASLPYTWQKALPPLFVTHANSLYWDCLNEVTLISERAIRQVLSNMHKNCWVFLIKHLFKFKNTKKLYTLHMKHYQKPKGNIEALINLCYLVCFKSKYLSFLPEVTWTWYQQCHVLPQHNAFHAT